MLAVELQNAENHALETAATPTVAVRADEGNLIQIHLMCTGFLLDRCRGIEPDNLHNTNI